jgi:hypothetical protein
MEWGKMKTVGMSSSHLPELTKPRTKKSEKHMRQTLSTVYKYPRERD